MTVLSRWLCRYALVISVLALSLASAIPGRSAGSPVLEPSHAALDSEWLPGIDNDQHITIFNGLLQGGGELGYVWGEDLYPRVTNRFSNQRKMIYMNLGALQAGGTSYDSTLAHEFQHVIHA